MMMMMTMAACLMAKVRVEFTQKLLKDIIFFFYIPSFCMLFSAGGNKTQTLSVLTVSKHGRSLPYTETNIRPKTEHKMPVNTKAACDPL
jgi:hypothetical protein